MTWALMENNKSALPGLIICLEGMIGASLSEPHTSVTALRMCVCMSVCLSVCGHVPKILNERI